jgi:hypothetical protein
VAGLFGLAVAWWCSPIDAAVSSSEPDGNFFSVTRLSALLLGARGLVPAGYVLLALVIGVTAGLVVRRVVPAMAITLAAVVAVQALMPLVVQPHLLSPERYTTAITPENLRGLTISESDDIEDLLVRVDKPGAWVTANHTVDADGKVVGQIPRAVADCSPDAGGEQTAAGPSRACFEKLAAAGYQQQVEYQPAGRYWPLQWIQTGILTGLAFLLTGFCFWRIRRDLT